jgi:hypothetical protein
VETKKANPKMIEVGRWHKAPPCASERSSDGPLPVMTCTLCGLASGEAAFCCAGCENVYAILVESGVVASGQNFRDTDLFQQSLKLGLISNGAEGQARGLSHRTPKRARPSSISAACGARPAAG